MELISAVFDHIFKGLKVDPSKYWVSFCVSYYVDFQIEGGVKIGAKDFVMRQKNSGRILL